MRERLFRWLVRALLVCGVVHLVALQMQYAESGYFCGDALECTFQALEMQKTESLFPSTWTATNFAHLQALPIFAGLQAGLGYVGANRLCLLTMLLLALLSVGVFGRRGLRTRSGVLVALFFLFPTSAILVHQVYTGVYYMQFVIAIFLVMTACLTNRLVPIVTALFFCCALLGARMMAVLSLPLMGAFVVREFLRQPSFSGGRRRWLPVCGLVAAIGLASYVGNSLYLNYVTPAFGVPALGVTANGLMQYAGSCSAVIANAQAVLHGAIRALGFPFGYQLGHPLAILCLLGFLAAVCVTIVLPVCEAFAYRRLDAKQRLLVLTAGFSLALTLFILCFGQLTRGDESNMCARYLILPGVLLLIVGASSLSRRCLESRIGWPGQVICLCLVLACASSMPARWAEQSQVANRCNHWRELTAKLEAEGLNYGYATYENALLPMFYAEGRVTIPHVMVESGRLLPPGWTMAARWYDPDAHVGPTFLMLTDDEMSRYAPDGLEKTLLGEPQRKLQVGPYQVLVYDDNIARDVFGTQAGSTKYLWGFQGPWIRNGRARMDLLVPDSIRGRSAELVLKARMFGETVRVHCGDEIIGSFHRKENKLHEPEDIRLPVPAHLLAGERLRLRFEVSGVKSPYERGWCGDRTKLGPCIEGAHLQNCGK